MMNEVTSINSNIVRMEQYNPRRLNSRIKRFDSKEHSIENIKNHENEEILSGIVVQLNSIIQSLTQTASGKESDYNMEKITERISNLERDVAVLKERTKKLDDLPTKAEIKSLFTDSINNSNIATKDHVDSKVEQTHTSIIKWMIGTTIALGGLIIAVIKIF
ncbi:hypothetical protein LNK20_08170 [Bacillus safensis]|uniref:hypothetical protein n=1 Tax=Bacillus safensis TaxID=561879 RepID=UPI001FFB972B|nr:hypothetical protein [Bacillus safensis]MCK1972683.1 hypothetical protein [Bacillus safensis]